MSLPYSYKNNFTFSTINPIDDINIIQFLNHSFKTDNSFKDIKLIENKLQFKTKKTLLNYFYNVEIDIEKSEKKLQINYKLNLLELIIISIFLFVFIPFFSKFSINSFFLFAIIIVLIFYFGSLMFMIHQLRQYFRALLLKNNIISEVEINIEQEMWLNNPNKCPACGFDINSNSLFCPDCGIRLNQNQYSKPLDLSKKTDSNNTINYHYKENKK